MSISSWNAGIIRPVPVAPTGPYQDGAAPGVWTLDQVAYWTQQGLWPTAGNLPPPIALFAGNYGGTQTNVIQQVVITTSGNTTDFGDLLSGLYGMAGFASTTRGIFAGGEDGVSPPAGSTNTIQYVTIASAGNATDFGDLTYQSRYQGGCNSSTRGISAGGYDPGNTIYINTINYVTIATTGNANDFGDLTVGRNNMTGGCSSSTRGVFAGANGGSGPTNVIDYITIASAGNATDFGDISFESRGGPGACANSTRGVFAGGMDTAYATLNVIQYVTLSSTGNATDFGDLTQTLNSPTAASSSITGLFAGGESGSKTNIINYVTIASTGNAVDFGDLLTTATSFAGLSSGNGGVQ